MKLSTIKSKTFTSTIFNRMFYVNIEAHSLCCIKLTKSPFNMVPSEGIDFFNEGQAHPKFAHKLNCLCAFIYVWKSIKNTIVKTGL